MPRWLTGLVLLFLVGHAACRALTWNHLEYDEAEQLVLVQSLEWGYYYQPPLYTWLLLPWIKLLGPTVFPLLIVRTVLFLVMFRLMFALAIRVTQHERLASLMTLTILLVPEVFHGALGMWPHTMMMVVCILATLLLILRLADAKSWRDYLLLGLCGALGMLSKYNYAHFIAALALSMLMVPRWRVVLLDRRIGASLLLAVTLTAPHGWWMVEHLDEVRHGVVRYTEEKQDQFSSWADSVRHIGTNIVQNLSRSNGFLLLPLLLIFVPCWRITRRDDGEVVPELHRLFVRLYIISAILLALAMVGGGVLHIRQHWLTAFAMLLPVMLLTRVDPSKLRTWQWRSYQGLIVFVIFAALCWRVGLIAWYGEQGCLSARSFQYLAYANQLRDSGWNTSGTAIVDQPYTAAYLRLYFPQARVHCLYFPMFANPDATNEEQVLVTWRERATRTNRKMREYLKSSMGMDAANRSDFLIVEEPTGLGANDSLRLVSVIVPGPPRSEAMPTVQNSTDNR